MVGAAAEREEPAHMPVLQSADVQCAAVVQEFEHWRQNHSHCCSNSLPQRALVETVGREAQLQSATELLALRQLVDTQQ